MFINSRRGSSSRARARRRKPARSGPNIRTPRQPETRRSGPQPGRGKFHRFLVRRRRLLAGVLAAAACGLAVQSLLPQEPRTVAVAAAGGDLPSGHVLASRDLRLVQLPPGVVPAGVFGDPGQAAGQQLAVPVRKGTVINETFLVGDGMLAGAAEGSSAVPLRPADPAAAALLSPGVLVDVVAASETGFDGAGPLNVLATAVPVLWITAADSDDAGPWSGSDEGPLVVVAAPAADAARLAVASAQSQLYLVPNGG